MQIAFSPLNGRFPGKSGLSPAHNFGLQASRAAAGRKRRGIWAVGGVLVAMWAIRGYATAAAAPSPTLAAALHDLSSDQYQQRQRGDKEIKAYFARQMTLMIHAVGPERANRVNKILQFNVELARWARAVLALPLKQRQTMFDWGLDDSRLHIVAEAFSPHPSVRAGAAKFIAHWPGPNADWLLLRLVSDPHRMVYLAAMNALWNRKPTSAIVHVVWRKVIANGGVFPGYNPAGRFVTFHGQKIPVPKNNNFWMQLQDSVYAQELMNHWNPPQLSALLTAAAKNAAENPNGPLANLFSNAGNSQAVGYMRLFRKARPVPAVPYFLYLLAEPVKFGSQMNFNNTPTYWDSRTNVAYLLALAMGKKKFDSLGFFHSTLFGGRWMFHNKGAEDKAIRSLVKFFAGKGIKPWHPSGRAATPRPPGVRVVPSIPPRIGVPLRSLPVINRPVPAAK